MHSPPLLPGAREHRSLAASIDLTSRLWFNHVSFPLCLQSSIVCQKQPRPFSPWAGQNNFVFHLRCFQEMIKPPRVGHRWLVFRGVYDVAGCLSLGLGVPAAELVGVSATGAGAASPSAPREALALWTMPFSPLPESLGVCCVRAGPQEPWLRWPLAWNEEWSKGRLWDVLCFRVALITRMTLCSVPAWQPRGVADTWGTAAGSVGALAVRGSQLAVTKSCCLFLFGMEIPKHASACCVEGMKVFSGMPPTWELCFKIKKKKRYFFLF